MHTVTTITGFEGSERFPTVLSKMDALLSSFTAQRTTLTLSELSRRSGVPKATAHRLANEMASIGLLERTPEGLSIGLRLFELGALTPGVRELRAVARPEVAHLSRSTRQTIHLGVLDKGEVVFIDKRTGVRLKSRLPSRLGGRFPAHASALGKSMLAFADKVDTTSNDLVRFTSHTLTRRQYLKVELEQVRDAHVAFDHQESSLGITCVASPIFNRDGEAIAAISISGDVGGMDLDTYAETVRTAARLVSRRVVKTCLA